MTQHTPPIKGRGTTSSLPGRFTIQTIELDEIENEDPTPSPITVLTRETAKSILTRNQSPDIPFDLSLNPYRGCEHGCIYCFARPTHAYLDLSPGIDFETRLSVKHNAPELFEQALRHPRYRCEPIALGVNTDAYQPVEKEQGVVRRLLEIALTFKQPLSIITKSALILRDLDLLTEMAQRNLIHCAVSVTTLDSDLKRKLEPRTASPAARLKVIRELSAAGIPVMAMAAPMIPLINDHELEAIIGHVAETGAISAGYILLRLPHEVAPLFVEWLQQHYPDRASHVLSHLTDMRGGKLYDGAFGSRMRGQGNYADLLNQRFHLAIRKSGLGERGYYRRGYPELNCEDFKVPARSGDQLALW